MYLCHLLLNSLHGSTVFFAFSNPFPFFLWSLSTVKGSTFKMVKNDWAVLCAWSEMLQTNWGKFFDINFLNVKIGIIFYNENDQLLENSLKLGNWKAINSKALNAAAETGHIRSQTALLTELHSIYKLGKMFYRASHILIEPETRKIHLPLWNNCMWGVTWRPPFPQIS
jgi:hypothetical protein